MIVIGLSDKKQTSTQTGTQQGSTSNTYGWQPHPGSADIDTLRNQKFQIDPSIGYRLGEKERQLSDSFVSPTGGYVTPQIRDAITRSGRRDLMQQAGQQTREGQFDVNKLNYAKNAAVAGMTAPVLTQTGSSSSGSSTGSGTVRQSESPWGTVASIGTSLAPLSL